MHQQTDRKQCRYWVTGDKITINANKVKNDNVKTVAYLRGGDTGLCPPLAM